jgi:hypothetical protein
MPFSTAGVDRYGIELAGPALSNNHGQEKSSEAYHSFDFSIDW